MSNLELLERASADATCQMLSAAGYNLVGAGAVSLWAFGTGFVPLTAGGLSLLAANYLCPEMPLGGEPPIPSVDGCQTMSPGGYGQVQYKDNVDWKVYGNSALHSDKATQITEVRVVELPGRGWQPQVIYDYEDGEGPITTGVLDYPTKAEAEAVVFRIVPTVGTCADQGGDGVNPLPPEATQPINYYDEVTNCNYVIKLEGFAQVSEGGAVNPVWRIEGATTFRQSGGVMGGCNFPPTIYTPGSGGGNGGGGGTDIPIPSPEPGPIGDLPWWVGPLATAITGALLNQLAESVNDLLAPALEEGSFTLTAPCNKDDEGNPLQREWTFPAQREPQRLLAHQVALMEILQQHLDWKTPICDETTIPEGDFRTISFRSDETSPYGKSRLRKRFRYRSVSGNDLGSVVDHWKDFSWEGGPYRVRWIGGPWRSPEIWAASEAEGKRVIQHAAAEAGFSPLEGGRWSTRVGSSGRQGVPGTMRVDTTGGYYWVTARDGSDQRPMVALT